MVGAKLEQFFPDEGTRLKLFEHPNQPIEGELLHCRRLEDAGRIDPAVRRLRRKTASRYRGPRPAARKQAEQHIRFLAHHDALTGIPNRDTFNKKLDQEIEAALATGRRLAVLCLDLDRFKEVNDLFGHAAGDTSASGRREAN